nr:rod shape-determining protein MreC [Marinobacterium ramblicola]
MMALLLIISDLNWTKMKEGRAYLSLVTTPLQWLVDLPARAADNLSGVVVSRATLLSDNERLRSEALILERKVQQNAALIAENIRLRELLGAAKRVEEPVKLAELIGVNPDPFQHEVIINRGSEDGVYEGQPALDAGGIMGQVVTLSHYTARVMLVTDARAALPVEINRNGFRAIVLGKGDLQELELEHVADTADVRVGDLLVTSGLAGRFPRGYPVAEVTEVIRDPGRQFVQVKARPSARLDKSRHLLLVDHYRSPVQLPAEAVDE